MWFLIIGEWGNSSMDVGFEFLLPIESKLSAIKFEQPFMSGQGEKFPQGPEEAWFNYFKLIKSNVPEHIISLLPNNFQKEQWQCVAIIDGVDNLIDELSIDSNILQENNILFNLFSSLAGVEKKMGYSF
ncbi:hypothetical protein Solca_2467 [Solitalea canadensis DSM 3403]|uniref:Uncharacterized protein n=1 Tax=Solitalea canadensis (strain ATCC 29591 / DSM 3403 / JCM 21819 / LMG 8368 / NBRC 15130 / NCIMB 12057 / USAM 9D) TaxID=929556 RepID=H8KRI2_SOLCM|nr:hypothetical protein Solca_2467 [Solitalea canadensis DSM 3403]